MKVLALLSDAFGGHGGIARYNRDLLMALDAAELVDEVVVLPRRTQFEPGQLPGKVRQLPPIFHPARYSLKALRLALALPPDSCILCGHILMSPLAAGLATMTGLPMWLQVHGIDAWAKPNRIVRWGAEAAELVTSVSRYTRSEMVGTWWGGDPVGIRVLPNTVDRRYSPSAKPLRILDRHELGGRKVILTVSRMATSEKYKGHDTVVASLPTIRMRYPDVVYLLVGGGDDVERIGKVAERFGVSGNVAFAGQVSDDDLPRLLQIRGRLHHAIDEGGLRYRVPRSGRLRTAGHCGKS